MDKLEEIRKLNQELETAKLNKKHREEDYSEIVMDKIEQNKEQILRIIEVSKELNKYKVWNDGIEIRKQFEKYIYIYKIGSHRNSVYAEIKSNFMEVDSDYVEINEKLELNFDKDKCPSYIRVINYILNNLNVIERKANSLLDNYIEKLKEDITKTNQESVY